LGYADLAQLSVLALYQVQGLVEFAASAAAVGFTALAQALGQSAAKEPAIESEASKLRAKVALDGGEFGAMEIVIHGTDDFTPYTYSPYKIDIRNTRQKWNANLLWKDGRSENESNQALISVAKSALRNR
jgi:hypothetical protein